MTYVRLQPMTDNKRVSTINAFVHEDFAQCKLCDVILTDSEIDKLWWEFQDQFAIEIGKFFPNAANVRILQGEGVKSYDMWPTFKLECVHPSHCPSCNLGEKVFKSIDIAIKNAIDIVKYNNPQWVIA